MAEILRSEESIDLPEEIDRDQDDFVDYESDDEPVVSVEFE